MNHTKNNKRSKLTRQGISFLLAFVLMLSVFAPGAAYATGGEGGTADPVPCTVCNVVDCGQTHVWCESHEVWDCREEHPPVNLPLDPVCPGDDTCTIEGCTNHAPKCPGDDSCTIEGCPNHAPKCPGDDSCTIEGCPNHEAKPVCGNCSGEHETGACTLKTVTETRTVFHSAAKASGAEVKSPTFTKVAERREEDGFYNLKLSISGAFAQESSPAEVDIVLIIDRSGSMIENTVSTGETRFANAKAAAQSLVRAVSGNANISAQYNIITFEGRITKNDENGETRDWNTVSGWQTTADTALSTIQTIPIAIPGAATNYEAAFEELRDALSNRNRTGAAKVVIFLTDGDPTVRTSNEDDTAAKREGVGYIDDPDHYFGSGMTNSTNVQRCLDAAIAEIKNIAMDRFYAIGTGSVTSANLEKLGQAAKNAGYVQVKTTADKDLTAIFNDIAAEITNFYCDKVSVTDTLKHVDNQLMVNVIDPKAVYVTVYNSGTKIAGPAKSVTLGQTEDNAQAVIRARYDEQTHQLSLEFPENYKLEKTYTYEISTVIAPTEKAYREYRVQNGYTATGAAGTGTHAGEAGFQSNESAIATYNYMGSQTTVVYEHPVIRLDPGSLTVSKSFAGLTSDQIAAIQDLSFRVTLTYPDDGNGVDDETEVKMVPFSKMADTDGDGVYTYTITGLSPNTQYSVTESGGTVQGHTPAVTYENASGTVPKGESRTASIVNTYTTELTIGKTVTGNMGDVNLPFAFTVTIGERTETFSLKHGEQTTLRDIPIGALVTITETTSGYTATATLNDTAMEVKEGAVTFLVADIAPDTVWFTNNKTATIDTGVALDSLPYIIILASVAAAAVFLVLRRRSRYED